MGSLWIPQRTRPAMTGVRYEIVYLEGKCKLTVLTNSYSRSFSTSDFLFLFLGVSASTGWLFSAIVCVVWSLDLSSVADVAKSLSLMHPTPLGTRPRSRTLVIGQTDSIDGVTQGISGNHSKSPQEF